MSDKKKILIIEDETILGELLMQRLGAEGCETVWAVDGKAGMEKMREVLPDLVLLDIVMPKLDGIGVLKKIKEDEKTKNIPVVMLTNLDDTQKVAEAMQLGARSYLVKTDWKISDVIKKVEELFPKS